jgi:hypothetical protein
VVAGRGIGKAERQQTRTNTGNAARQRTVLQIAEPRQEIKQAETEKGAKRGGQE